MKISDVDLSNNESTSGESFSWLTLNPDQGKLRLPANQNLCHAII